MLKGAKHATKVIGILGLAAIAVLSGVALNAPSEPPISEYDNPTDDQRLELAAFTQAYIGHEVRDLAWAEREPLVSFLIRAGVPRNDADALGEAIGRVHSARPPDSDLGVQLSFKRGEDNEIEVAALSWRCELGAYISAVRTGEMSFTARHIEIPLAFEVARIRGRVGASLGESALALGATGREVEALANAFAYSLDFQREIRPRDQFEIVFERLFDEAGRTVRTGRTLFIAITSQSGGAWFFSFQPAGERTPAWYNNLGHSAQRSLMRTPVEAARISSGFGVRGHPILGYSAMHHGVDFAAPTGTPVLAVGDGLIVRSGVFGSYGNYVRIRHAGGYETAYAHLELPARGIRAGVRVRQNQVIGYVGSSGRATGPHLHYEVFQGGVQMDPMRVRGTLTRALSGADYEAFRAEVERIDALRAALTEGETRVPSAGVAPVISTISRLDVGAPLPAFVFNAGSSELAWDGDGAGPEPAIVLTRLGPIAPTN
jgi:murein DD-endopeptidase MepM/ murein hydrolase activator NlpD